MTKESKTAAHARIGTRRALRERDGLLESMRSSFAETQTFLRAGRYLAALCSDLPARNGWTIAEWCGERSPDGMQRLLSRASWDEGAVMSQVRRHPVAGLDRAAKRWRRPRMTVGALDETGQQKHGGATAGAKRQYMGCAGRVANGINSVHLAHVRCRTGHALIGARQWVPAEHLEDPVKREVMGLPEGMAFCTKGQLAISILQEARADGMFAKDYFGLDQYQARLYRAVRRHLVLVMAALAICAVTAAGLREATDTQAPPPTAPGQPPAADPGLVPLSVSEVRRLLSAAIHLPRPSWLPVHWLHWRRRHHARAPFHHQRTRLARNYPQAS